MTISIPLNKNLKVLANIAKRCNKMEQKYQDFEKMFTLADFLTQDITCTKAKMGEGIGFADWEGFTLIGQKEVPRQVLIALGVKFSLLREHKGGLFHIELHDASGNDIEGEYRIVFRNHEGTIRRKIIERNSNTMYKTAPTDRSHQSLVSLGIQTPFAWARERSYVQLWFKPNTDGVTIDYDSINNVLFIEYTMREIYSKTPDVL